MTEEIAIISVFGGILIGIAGLFIAGKKHEDDLKNKRQKIRVKVKKR